MIHFYECSDCHFYFPAAERDLKVCPHCETESLEWKRCQTGSMPEPRKPSRDLPQIMSKSRTRPDGFYDMQHRGFHPGIGKHFTADQYESAHEKAWHEAQQRSREAKDRNKLSRKSDECHIEHKGSIPLAQFLARQAEVNGDTDQLFDTDYWKHEGRIFDHAKDE